MSRLGLIILVATVLAGCAGSWDPSSTSGAVLSSTSTSSTPPAPPVSTTTPPPPPPPPPGEPSFAAVAITQGAYEPAQVTVPAGSIVTWSNRDGARHSVTSDDAEGELDGDLPPHTQYNHKFQTPGTFRYHCEFHNGMAGQVIVT